MTITTQRQFRINGVVDTDRPVWENCELLAESATSWMTYGYFRGQIGVIINAPAQPIKHFNDSNIIGEITVTEIPLRDLYNSVEIDFPHVDLLDQRDLITFSIPENQRLERETPNTLNISTDFFNNPVQAQQIALTEIRQSRLNIIVNLSTDYTSMDLTAGDVVELSNDYYGWDKKKFRVMNVTETDAEEGSIVLNFVLLEYSDVVYDYSNLSRLVRSRKTGIPGAFVNQNIQTANSVNVAKQLSEAALTNEGRDALSEGGIPTVTIFTNGWSPAEVAGGVNAPGSSFGTIIEATLDIKSVQIVFYGPSGFFTYIVDNTTKTVASGIPLGVSFEVQPPGGSFQLIESRVLEWSTYTTTVVLNDIAQGSIIRILATPINTLSLGSDDPVVEYVSGSSIAVNPSGDAAAAYFTVIT